MNDDHIDGFDYLRAIMSIFVVVWHLGGGGSSLIFSQEQFQNHTFAFSDLVNFQILTLAVPAFVFVSVYLYVYRGVSGASLRKRLKRLGILLAFWPAALIIFLKDWRGISDLAPQTAGQFFQIIFTAGNTIYYFFVSLGVCLIAAHYFARLKLALQIGVFIAAVALLSLLPEVTKATGIYQLSAHWNPFNFIPLSLGAVIMSQNILYVRKYATAVALACFSLYVTFSIIEWRYDIGEIFFPGQGSAIPSYTRVSLLFGVLLLGTLFLRTGVRSGKVIRYMAAYSLALYCLHVFLKEPVKAIVTKVTGSGLGTDYGTIVLVILGCYLTAKIVNFYFRDRTVI